MRVPANSVVSDCFNGIWVLKLPYEMDQANLISMVGS